MLSWKAMSFWWFLLYHHFNYLSSPQKRSSAEKPTTSCAVSGSCLGLKAGRWLILAHFVSPGLCFTTSSPLKKKAEHLDNNMVAATILRSLLKIITSLNYIMVFNLPFLSFKTINFTSVCFLPLGDCFKLLFLAVEDSLKTSNKFKENLKHYKKQVTDISRLSSKTFFHSLLSLLISKDVNHDFWRL